MDYNFLRSLNFGSLKRTDLGANLNFESAIIHITSISKELLYFEGKENLISDVEIDLIRQINTLFVNYVNQIQEFSQPPNESAESAMNRRNTLLAQIKNLKTKVNQELLPIVLDLKINTDNQLENTLKNFQEKSTQLDNVFNSKVQNFDTASNQKLQEIQNKLEETNRLSNEARQIKEEAKNFTIDKLVQKYGEIFSIQARKNKILAIVSLVIFIILLVGSIFLAYKLFKPLVEEVKNIVDSQIRIEYVIVNALFRLTLLGIALFAVKESLKNFNINMHLYSLNLHRQNTLQSFDTLISTTTHPEARDLIVKEIAQTIYGNQDDGYLSNSYKKTISITQVTDLIKALK